MGHRQPPGVSQMPGECVVKAGQQRNQIGQQGCQKDGNDSEKHKHRRGEEQRVRVEDPPQDRQQRRVPKEQQRGLEGQGKILPDRAQEALPRRILRPPEHPEGHGIEGHRAGPGENHRHAGEKKQDIQNHQIAYSGQKPDQPAVWLKHGEPSFHGLML